MIMSHAWAHSVLSEPTYLGVGVVSKNTVDAALRASRRTDLPLYLISSRRQVDSERHGGGYVNKWSTEAYSAYVRSQRTQNLILARDHGGPYQGRRVDFFSESESLDDAMESFRADIRAGFNFLHFDTCLARDGFATVDESFSRLKVLLADALDIARSNGISFSYEVGTEDQVNNIAVVEETAEMVRRIVEISSDLKTARPDYIVVQTGTKVQSTSNIGRLSSQSSILSLDAATLSKLASSVRKHGMKIKSHNGDYLSYQTLQVLNGSGIGGLNVAPEFGTLETQKLLYLLLYNDMNDEYDAFVQNAVASKKWEKWVGHERDYSDLDLAIICGHYTFSDEVVEKIKGVLDRFHASKGWISVDQYLTLAIEKCISYYMHALGYKVS